MSTEPSLLNRIHLFQPPAAQSTDLFISFREKIPFATFSLKIETNVRKNVQHVKSFSVYNESMKAESTALLQNGQYCPDRRESKFSLTEWRKWQKAAFAIAEFAEFAAFYAVNTFKGRNDKTENYLSMLILIFIFKFLSWRGNHQLALENFYQ